jgi:quercetin dioxygenase-like cupin family protein
VPTINKPIVLSSGDSVELLETSATTGGAYTRARFVFAAGGLRVPAHIHPLQEEKLEIVSGKLTYYLAGDKHVAEAGTIVLLPRGTAHQHHSEDAEAAVVIQTMTPGLDFDYLLENLFGLGSEGRLQGWRYFVYLTVILGKMDSAFVGANLPIWFQKVVAKIVTPILYLFGYRAVNKRFSGEEW